MMDVPPNSAMPSTRGLNFFEADPNLSAVLALRAGPGEAERALPVLRELGEIAGTELDELATIADRNPPVLVTHDREGRRVDEIVYHPAYRRMQELGFCRFGFAAMSHRPGVLGWPGTVPHVVKYALSYVFVQAEFGLFCPISMTDSAARVLRLFGPDELRARYLPGLTSTSMETLLQSAQLITERTGGSDVGASECEARPADGYWEIWGEKWFCSNAGADVHLVLARPPGAPRGTRGLGLFLVPKLLPDGSRNRYVIRRLKEKLGSRSMPTGEYEFHGAVGYVVGQLDRGFHQMAEMINVSRLSNGMRAAALMRRALLEAAVHTKGRSAFGRALADLPLVREQLLELVLDAESAISIVLYAAAALDAADGGSEGHQRVVRILTPLIKYAVCRQARSAAGLSMNLRGGNGYIEEWPNARLLRDAYLGSIWEGAENVVALDVARAARKEAAHEALLADLEGRLARATDPVVSEDAAAVLRELASVREGFARFLDAWDDETEARITAWCDRLAAVTCAALLAEEADAEARQGRGYRKAAVARAYRLRRAERRDPLGWRTPPASVLRAILDGAQLDARALAAIS
ncbi:Putative acyl-CoA dehydrogenase AidB [bacterium HR29]|jgi:acyl-CoA dehydrogenase|nr:Putative acyl-CoA dehydrogenase AidB [bacterium HR29]